LDPPCPFAAVTLTLFYDTVAYYTKGQPQKGDAKYSTEWNGAKWQFATEESLQAFKVDPEHYAPQYGGAAARTRRDTDRHRRQRDGLGLL
jgi:YHS domain-containing protein